jgi:hypothetical protein
MGFTYTDGTGEVKTINLYLFETLTPKKLSVAIINGLMYNAQPGCLGIQFLSRSANCFNPSINIFFGGTAMHILSRDFTKRS